MWNPRWRPRNGCDSRLMAKSLITTIQVNLVPNPSEMWRRQPTFTWIVVIKKFAISLPSRPFLGHHLGFHIFFHNGLFGAAHFFYSWAVLDWIILLLSTLGKNGEVLKFLHTFLSLLIIEVHHTTVLFQSNHFLMLVDRKQSNTSINWGFNNSLFYTENNKIYLKFFIDVTFDLWDALKFITLIVTLLLELAL